jgi:glycosyltransferase involved in cell wall biosynthesis
MPEVAIIDPTGNVSGVRNFLVGLLAELESMPEAEGWTFTLLTPAVDMIGREVSWPTTLSSFRVGVAYLPAQAGGAQIAGELETWIAAHRPAVAYVSAPYRMRPLRPGIPLLATFHDFNYKRFETIPLGVRQEIDAEMPGWIDACDVVVVSSEFIAAEVSAYFPRAAEKVRVIRLGIPALADRLSRSAWAQLRRRLALPDRFLLTVGWFAAHKNQLPLFEALALVRELGHHLPLVCVGPNSDQLGPHVAPRDPYVVKTAHRLAELDLRPGVDYWPLGDVEAAVLRTLYEHADALVVPSLYEAGSFPIREAMQLGCPVLCSDTPALVEDVKLSGGQASLFEGDDPAAIAAALQELIRAPEQARLRADAARPLVVKAFDWNRTARGYLQTFAAVAAKYPVSLN